MFWRRTNIFPKTQHNRFIRSEENIVFGFYKNQLIYLSKLYNARKQILAENNDPVFKFQLLSVSRVERR